MSLYQISKDFLTAFENIEVDEYGEILDLSELENIAAEFDNKAENIALYIKNLSSMSAQIKAEESNLYDRRKAIDNKIEGLKRYLSNCMKMVGKDRLETPKCRVSFRSSTAVKIENESDLPEEFVKVTEVKKPDKKALGDAIKAGREIDGVSLVTSRNIQIK